MQKKLRQKMFVCSDCPIICCDCVHGERPISETVYFPDGRFNDQPINETSAFRVCKEFARKHIDENGIIYYEPDPKRLKNHVVVFMDK